MDDAPPKAQPPMNICANCKHMRRGRAIDRRKAEPGYPAPAPRLGTRYICASLPIIAGKIDPLTGRQSESEGEDCRDLNPTGECSTYAQGSYAAEAGWFLCWFVGGLIGCALIGIFTALVAL